MKTLFLILFTFYSVSFSNEIKKEKEFREVKNTAFDYGEELYYDVGYGWIKAGEGHFKIMPRPRYVNGRESYDIKFSVKSLNSLAWIYQVHDRYNTWLDEEGIFPWRYEQHIREGGYKRDNFAVFDQENNLAMTNRDTTEVPDYVHDIVSALYYVRTMELKNVKNDSIIVLNQFYEDSTYTLGIKIHNREIIEVEAGKFKTILIEPLVVEGGLFKSEGSIKIWISDDEKKIPVKVSTKILIGSVSAELTRYKGIKGRVYAKID